MYLCCIFCVIISCVFFSQETDYNLTYFDNGEIDDDDDDMDDGPVY